MKTWRREQENTVISLRCTFQTEIPRNVFWPNPKLHTHTQKKKPFQLNHTSKQGEAKE